MNGHRPVPQRQGPRYSSERRSCSRRHRAPARSLRSRSPAENQPPAASRASCSARDRRLRRAGAQNTGFGVSARGSVISPARAPARPLRRTARSSALEPARRHSRSRHPGDERVALGLALAYGVTRGRDGHATAARHAPWSGARSTTAPAGAQNADPRSRRHARPRDPATNGPTCASGRDERGESGEAARAARRGGAFSTRKS